MINRVSSFSCPSSSPYQYNIFLFLILFPKQSQHFSFPVKTFFVRSVLERPVSSPAANGAVAVQLGPVGGVVVGVEAGSRALQECFWSIELEYLKEA